METLDSLPLNTDTSTVLVPDGESFNTILTDSTRLSIPGIEQPEYLSNPIWESDIAPITLEVEANNFFEEQPQQTIASDPTTHTNVPFEVFPNLQAINPTDSLIGNAIANAEAVASFQNTGTGLTAQYFDTLDFNNPVFTRTDATIDFDWGLGSPHGAIAPDSFSVRWTGKLQPLYTETYTFHTLSNDGVRLWVNGELLIDQWVRQDTTEHRGTISLEAGQLYDIQLDYYDRNGNAVSKLSWSSDSQLKEIVPTSQLYPIHLFPQPFPGDSEGLELQAIADLLYNPGETVSIAGKVSGEAVNANLNRIDLSLQKDGGEWIDITDVTEFTANSNNSNSVFFNAQLRNLEPGHYQLTATPVDQTGNSGDPLIQNFTILSLEAETAELSGRVLQAIAQAMNLDNYSPEQLAATREWVVSVKNGASLEQLATDFDAQNLGETGYIPNTYFWEFPPETDPQEIASRLGEEIKIEFAYPLVPLDIEFFSSPTNEPNFSDQWHLQNSQLSDVWDNHQGSGVVIGIVDDGFEIGHSDLSSNYRRDLSQDFDENDGDPSHPLSLTLKENRSYPIYTPESLNAIPFKRRNSYSLDVESFSGSVSGLLRNATLTLDIKDVEITQLDISLISPEGTRVDFSEFTNLGNGKFSASTDVFNGQSPNTHPIEKNYKWLLEIDNRDQTNGVLKNWSLTLETSNRHGTAVAGIAAARGDNGLLGTGVAPLADWAGLRLGADGFRDNEIADALSHRNQEIDIYNNSWGPGFFQGPSPSSLWYLEEGTKNGREGLGSIYVFAAGNEGHGGDNVNYNGFANSRHTIAVAAIDSTGAQTFYSNPGAPVLISASANNVDSFFASPEVEEYFWDFDELFLSQIEDGESLFSTLDVNEVRGEMTGVEVNLNIGHRDYEDLQVVLESPSGTEVELFADAPFTEIDRLDRQLSENVIGVAPSISLSSAGQRQIPQIGDIPTLFLGIFQPSGDLNEFIGEDANGTWQLKITDKSGNVSHEDNKLYRWSLNISTDGIGTTDIAGDEGYAPGDYTGNFGGTSAAAPFVSGVIALMLEANPNLSWRDVQQIIIETADINDPTDEDWTTNGAGYQVNHKYGFGAINVAAAVETSLEWKDIDKTLGEEASMVSGEAFVYEIIPDYDEENPRSVRSTIELETGDELTVEWAEVHFQATHSYRGDLEVVLVHTYEDLETGEIKVSESVLAEPHVDEGEDYDWWFTTARHWGEPATGEWTLRVSDLWEEDEGVFQTWKLNLFGEEVSAPNFDFQKFLAPDGAIGDNFGYSVALDGNYVLIGSRADDNNEINSDSIYLFDGINSGSAYLFDVTSGDFVQKFIAPDPASVEYFGYSVALDRDYALIGSYGDSDNGSWSGSAYLFDVTSGDLIQKIIAPDGASDDRFGWSVALDENYVLIGSPLDDDSGSKSGSAYLFDVTSGDLIQKIIAPDGASDDHFGWSVALDENYVLIGSAWDESNGFGSGSAYLFEVSSGDFVQKITAPDSASGDLFGLSVALDGEYALIGSSLDDDNGENSGSAYLFDITSGDFLRKFLAPDGASDDLFGRSVALDGNNALIGSPLDDDNGIYSGSAYLFDIISGDFREKFIAIDGAINDSFGHSVAIDGDSALIGSYWDDDKGRDSGSAYLFPIEPKEVATPNLEFNQKFIAPDRASFDFSTNSVALDGDSILIGSYFDDDEGNSSQGSAYLFDATNGDILQEFRNPKGDSRDYFGWSIALDGNHALISAAWDEGHGFGSGSAFLFDATTGDLLQNFIPTDFTHQFGYSVAVDGNYALVGSYGDNDNGFQSGSAFLFDISSGELVHKFIAPDAAIDDRFGYSVALYGDYALIGSWLDDDNGTDSGSAYLFDINSGELVHKIIAPDAASGDIFGISVTLDGDYMLIGSVRDDDRGIDSGSAYLFDISSGDLIHKINAPDGAAFDAFGASVALDGDYALIGAHGDDDNGDHSGSAYLFDIISGDFIHKIIAPDGASGDWFGRSVALDGNSLLFGSRPESNDGSKNAAAYLFTIE